MASSKLSKLSAITRGNQRKRLTKTLLNWRSVTTRSNSMEQRCLMTFSLAETYQSSRKQLRNYRLKNQILALLILAKLEMHEIIESESYQHYDTGCYNGRRPYLPFHNQRSLRPFENHLHQNHLHETPLLHDTVSCNLEVVQDTGILFIIRGAKVEKVQKTHKLYIIMLINPS